MIIDGKVVRKMFGQGSKSEHEAVFLVSTDAEYVLRRAGGNPFFDQQLNDLVGKQVRIDGTIQGYHLIVEKWQDMLEK